jgi:hypothetical protein
MVISSLETLLSKKNKPNYGTNHENLRISVDI